MQRLAYTALVRLAEFTRRGLTRLARRSVTAGLLLQHAGVDVDRLAREGRPST